MRSVAWMPRWGLVVLVATLLGIGAIAPARRGHREVRLIARAPTPAPSASPAATAPAFRLALVDTDAVASLRRAGLSSEDADALADLLSEHPTTAAPRPVVVRLSPAGRLDTAWSLYNRDATLRVTVANGEARAEEVAIPTRSDTIVISGKVAGSLYESIVQEGGNARIPLSEREAIVDALADRIFVSSINFANLQPDDEYRISYAREVRWDGSSKKSRIVAVQFNVAGTLHEAYRFTAAGKDGFFDRFGRPLRRSSLTAPLAIRHITSTFARERFHPILGITRPHLGVDYGAATGTPVHAVADGTVAVAGYSGGYGKLVRLRHANGIETRYGHLSRFAKGVREGLHVRQGQVIGYVGSTGLSTGPHLHFEVHKAGAAVNPASVKSLPGAALAGAAFRRFHDAVAGEVRRLRSSGR